MKPARTVAPWSSRVIRAAKDLEERYDYCFNECWGNSDHGGLIQETAELINLILETKRKP